MTTAGLALGPRIKQEKPCRCGGERIPGLSYCRRCKADRDRATSAEAVVESARAILGRCTEASVPPALLADLDAAIEAYDNDHDGGRQ